MDRRSQLLPQSLAGRAVRCSASIVVDLEQYVAARPIRVRPPTTTTTGRNLLIDAERVVDTCDGDDFVYIFIYIYIQPSH